MSRGVWTLLLTSSALICLSADNQTKNVEFAFPVNQSFSPQVRSYQVSLSAPSFPTWRRTSCMCLHVCLQHYMCAECLFTLT